MQPESHQKPAHIRMKNTTDGFTLLELVVVIIIISVLGLFAIDRIWNLRIEAEQAVVTKIIGNIRSALGLEVSRLALNGRLGDIARLEKSNPVELLAQAPGSYINATDSDNDNHKKSDNNIPGVWYFDKNINALVYNVIYEENLKTSLAGRPRIRFQIKLIYSDKNKNNKYDPGIDTIGGLDLLPVEKFSWNNKLQATTLFKN